MLKKKNVTNFFGRENQPFYENIIIIFWIIGLVLLSAFSASAGPLNEKKLQQVVWERLKQDKRMENLGLDQITILKKIPIPLKNLSLWAVHIQIQLETPKTETKKPAQVGTLVLVTDDQAERQFENISDIKTGRPFLEKALAELTKTELDPRIGQVVFRGKGKYRVVLFTDNFCPYCRTAYQNIPGVYAGQIKELVFIYLPLAIHPGSEMACTISSYVHNQKGLQSNAKQLDDFIFKQLNQPTTKVPAEANAEVYEAVKVKFPWFAKEFSGLTWEKGFEKLKSGSTIGEQIKYAGQLNVSATPAIFVDGRRMDGLDLKKFERYLTY